MNQNQQFSSSPSTSNQAVKVGIRVRPLNEKEKEKRCSVCVSAQNNKNSIQIKSSKQGENKQYIFDYVFDLETSQDTIYDSCAYPIIQNSMEGFNGTIFAYGQTGAGKTYTMVGDYRDDYVKGIIPRAFEHIIASIQVSSEDKLYIVHVSFLEIYKEDIIDLLEEKSGIVAKKDIKEDPSKGVFVKDLKMIPVKTVDELYKVLDYGNKHRTVFATAMNAVSSRSHAIFTVHIESAEGNSKDKIKTSKLNLIDLAGSERASKTEAVGDRLKEGVKINLSLSALGNVINALVEGKSSHIPYRDSKLTRLLQDSLGGNTKTLMIASVSPAQFNYDQTLSTIRYAARARNIKNKPKVNQDPKDTIIRQYIKEIQTLKKQLQEGNSTESTPNVNVKKLQEQASNKEKMLSEKQSQISKMKAKLQQMEELVHKNKQADSEEIKKRKIKKKKADKIEELLRKKLQQMSIDQKNLVEGASNEVSQEHVDYWKAISIKLRKKLKSVKSEFLDVKKEFQTQKQDLNQTIRNLEGHLSFYVQLVQKFLNEEDIIKIMKASKYQQEKRIYELPGFLMNEKQVSLPKTLSKTQVDDLWAQKRKGFKLQLLNQSSDLQDTHKIQFQKTKKLKAFMQNKEHNQFQYDESPFMQGRNFFKNYAPFHETYQQKQYTNEMANERVNRMFRRTDYRLAQMSGSKEHKGQNRNNSRNNSRTKLEPLSPSQRPKSRQFKIGIPRPRNLKSIQKGPK